MRINNLKIMTLRSEFQKLRSNSVSCASRNLVLRVCFSSENHNQFPSVAFVVTKKLGNAVFRNRIKRRLRSIASLVIPCFSSSNLFSHLIIARTGAFSADFDSLSKDLNYCVRRCYDHV